MNIFMGVFLIFFSLSFCCGRSQADNFTQYVNSPQSNTDNAEDISWAKLMTPASEENSKPVENSEKADDQQSWQRIPYAFKTCAVDSDCTAGVVACLDWESVNKKYSKELSKNMMTCSSSIDPGFQPQTACVDKTCQLTDKTTEVSWEDWLSNL